MIKQIVTSLITAFLFANSSLFAANLPSNLIALSSPAGSNFFNRSYSPEYFWPLALQFVTQENLGYCSIASSVMVLNALSIPAPKDSAFASYTMFTQDDFFTPEVEKVLPSNLVKKHGATLDQISRALSTYPVSIKTIHANDMTLNEFRDIAKNIIATKRGYIIVNFLRTGLGEEGTGHFSPLAAYDNQSDRFLMLDVARYRYPSVWIKTQDLWAAMSTIDKTANAYRGFVIIKKHD